MPTMGGSGPHAGKKCFVAQGGLIKYEPTLVSKKAKKRERQMKIDFDHEVGFKPPVVQRAFNSQQLRSIQSSTLQTLCQANQGEYAKTPQKRDRRKK